MKRLMEEMDLNGEDARLADLFRSAAPFVVDPFRKRRVLVGLERSQNRVTSRFWLKPAVVAAVLVSGTAAAAVISQGHPLSRFGFLGGAIAPSVAMSHSSSRPARAVATRPQSAWSEPVAPIWVDEAEAVESVPAASAEASGAGRGRRSRPDPSEDPTRVVEAIQALRTARDPARAQALLKDYLNSHPHGALSEEASALSMEAASTQHDPRAVAYARRYLASYPNGKYRGLAQHALEAAP